LPSRVATDTPFLRARRRAVRAPGVPSSARVSPGGWRGYVSIDMFRPRIAPLTVTVYYTVAVPRKQR
jgi:hypothetical protein